MRKFFSSFTALNITQFITALNDNYYKLLLAFFLISLLGEEHSNTILSIAGAVFVVPFLLFASLAGTLADRFSKRAIITLTRFIEIGVTSLAILAFLLHSVIMGYVVLFLMATLSTLFSPCKYGIIPEVVRKERISRCNGVITASTYLAIILGTFVASFLTEITKKNFLIAVLFCVAFSIISAFTSLGIEKTVPQAAKKKVSVRFLSVILKTLKRARRQRYLLTTIVFGAYFLFMGAYTQLNIIPFALQSLGLSEVHGGYLFLMTAIGIGIGSFLAGRFSVNEVELGFVPLAAFGVSICYLMLYVFDTHFFVVVAMLVGTGLFGGFFAVPIDAFIQVASLDRDRGQNVATANFLSFIGVVIASGLIALFGNALNLKAAEGFFIVGWLTVAMSITLFFLYADQVLRLLVAMGTRLFCRVRVWGKGRVHPNEPSLIIAPRSSWLDTLVVMATLPRLIRYIVPIRNGSRRRRFFYRLLCLIPMEREFFSPLGEQAFAAIKKELRAGHSVCLMYPVDFPEKTLKEWDAKIESIVMTVPVPVVPVHIEREPPEGGASRLAQLFSLTRGQLKVSYGSTKNNG